MKQTIIKLIDDLDGGAATETIEFSLDADTYTIDLSTKNAARLRKALQPFTAKATRVTAGRPRVPQMKARERREIRQWAVLTGKFPDLGKNGRIPEKVVAAYLRSRHR